MNKDKILLRKLIKFHEATMDALSRQRQGHSDGWSKVVSISDDIEDNYDLVECAK